MPPGQKTLIDLCATFLRQHPGEKFDVRQLADAVYQANKKHFARKRTSYEKTSPNRSVIYQIEREIYARRRYLIANSTDIVIENSDKIRFLALGNSIPPKFETSHASNTDFLEPTKDYSAPPSVPEQGIGPKFRLRADGIIDFAEVHADFDPRDLARLKSLHEVVLEAAQDLVRQFSDGTNLHASLAALARSYLEQVQRTPEQIDFARLYGIGLRLQTALEAAERDISDRLLPDLEDPQLEALRSLTQLHGVFIQSSRVGRQLLSEAERYQLRREDIPELKRALAGIGANLAAHPEVADNKIAMFFAEAAQFLGLKSHPERAVTYSIEAFSNLAVVLVELATVTWLATDLGIAIGGTAGISAAILARHRGKDALRFVKKMVDDLENVADRRLKKLIESGSKKYVDFVLDNEALLRRLSEFSARLKFIGTHIDWLRKQQRRSG